VKAFLYKKKHGGQGALRRPPSRRRSVSILQGLRSQLLRLRKWTAPQPTFF
jgi:hypothetical protein